MNSAVFGTPVVESRHVPVDQVFAVNANTASAQLIVREFAQFRWRIETWGPLLSALRRDVQAHLAALIADQELRLFGGPA